MQLWKKGLYVTVIAIIPFVSFSQKGSWEKVMQIMEVPSDKSREEIKAELLKLARQKAIENVSGVNVESVALSNEGWNQDGDDNTFFQSFRVLSNVSSQGMIIQEKEPRYADLEGNRIQIDYQGKVAVQSNESDPGFTLQCDINRQNFQVGDELKLTARASQDAYLTIFSITEDEQAALMFPNAYMTNQQLQAHVPRKLPNARESQNIALTLQSSPDGRKKYSEVLVCVITKTPISYQAIADELTYDANWLTVNRWIMKIPADQKALAYLQYQVIDN